VFVTDNDRQQVLALLPRIPETSLAQVIRTFDVKIDDPQITQNLAQKATELFREDPKLGLRFAMQYNLGKDIDMPILVAALIQNQETSVLQKLFRKPTDVEPVLQYLERECEILVERRETKGGKHTHMINFIKKINKTQIGGGLTKRHVENGEFKNMFLLMDMAMLNFMFFSRMKQTGDIANWNELLVLFGKAHELFQYDIFERTKQHFPSKQWFRTQFGAKSYFNTLCGGGSPYLAPEEPYNLAKDRKAVPEAFLTLSQVGTMPLQLYMVSTQEELDACLTTLTADSTFVGMDFEWRPRLFTIDTDRCALWQLATDDLCFFIDMVKLPTTAIQQFAAKLLSAPNVTLIGYGLSGDSAMLKTATGDASINLSNVHDVQTMGKQLVEFSPEYDLKGGLSGACKFWFGNALDKRNQMSDWERRPLRKSQEEYAALDAKCLLPMYRKVKAKITELQLTKNTGKISVTSDVKTGQNKSSNPNGEKNNSQSKSKRPRKRQPKKKALETCKVQPGTKR
ncbi:hypothetical protein SARC_06177, partial [Sphaeroforma arctica JP610]